MSSPSLRPLIDTCQKCSTSPANHEPVRQRTGFSKSRVCLQAVPSFPSPTPTVLFLALASFSPQAKYRKPRSSVFLCSQTLRKGLLRRLEEYFQQLIFPFITLRQKSHFPSLRHSSMVAYAYHSKINNCFLFSCIFCLQFTVFYFSYLFIFLSGGLIFS